MFVYKVAWEQSSYVADSEIVENGVNYEDAFLRPLSIFMNLVSDMTLSENNFWGKGSANLYLAPLPAQFKSAGH